MKQFLNKFRQLYIFVCFFLFVSFPALSPGQSLYKWVDDEGTVHMTDTLSQVPLKYRDQVRKKEIRDRAATGGAPETAKKYRRQENR